MGSRRHGRPSSCTSGTTRSPMKLCTCGSCSKRSVCGLGWRTNARVHSTIDLSGTPRRPSVLLACTAPARTAPHEEVLRAVGESIWLAEVPEQSRHHTEALPGDRRKQVLVGGMLRASGVRVRDPDRAQAEHVGEAVVGKRSAEIGENDRRASGGVLDRAGGETDPRVLGVEPARAEKSATAAADLDLRKTVAVEVAAQRRNDVVDIRSDHIPQMTIGARLTGNGVDRVLRRASGEGQNLEAVPAEDPLRRREIRLAPVAIDDRTISAAVDLDA